MNDRNDQIDAAIDAAIAGANREYLTREYPGLSAEEIETALFAATLAALRAPRLSAAAARKIRRGVYAVSSARPAPLVSMRRAILVAAAFILATSSLAVASMTADPSSPLYPIKQGVEIVESLLSVTPEGKVAARIRQAERRAAEARVLSMEAPEKFGPSLRSLDTHLERALDAVMKSHASARARERLLELYAERESIIEGAAVAANGDLLRLLEDAREKRGDVQQLLEPVEPEHETQPDDTDGEGLPPGLKDPGGPPGNIPLPGNDQGRR